MNAVIEKWINAHVDSERQRQVLLAYLDTDLDRQAVAMEVGVSLEELLSLLNETAPISDPFQFEHRGRKFCFTVMNGFCDDVHGDRYGKFGLPVTLRIYLQECEDIPAILFSLADWNRMSAGRDYFLGYIYGSVADGVFYIDGLQSDISQRYTYLFQKPSDTHVIYRGNLVPINSSLLVRRYSRYVPAIRRSFQRRWKWIFLDAVRAYCEIHNLHAIGLIQFPLNSREMNQGHIVNRIYRQLVQKFPGILVSGDAVDKKTYYVIATASLEGVIK